MVGAARERPVRKIIVGAAHAPPIRDKDHF